MDRSHEALPSKRNFRILMTADTAGGVWDYALELSRALAPHGCDVVLAVMGKLPSASQRAAAEQLGNLLLCTRECRLEWMQDPWRDVDAAAEWLLSLESYAEPDVVHLNGYAHAALPWRTPVLLVGHSCVASWFEAVRGEPMEGQWNEYRRRVERGLRAADLVTAPSAAMLDSLTKHYGSFRAAAPIYNGRSAAEFTPGLKEPIVFAVGRLWDDAKNLHVLEDVAPALSWPVYIAGEDRAPDSNHSVAFTAVTRLGVLDHAALTRWFSCATIFAHPALYEPFGLAVLEAALAGCALVLGDIASLREIWSDAALFVRPDDKDGLAVALQDLIVSPANRKHLARAARRRALQFSPARMANGYMQLYQELISEHVHAVQTVPPLRGASTEPGRSVPLPPQSSPAVRGEGCNTLMGTTE